MDLQRNPLLARPPKWWEAGDFAHPVSASHHERIDPARGLRIEEYQGKVGLGDMRSIVSAMAWDPCWSPDHQGLVDFSEAELEMSANDMLRLALMLRQEAETWLEGHFNQAPPGFREPSVTPKEVAIRHVV